MARWPPRQSGAEGRGRRHFREGDAGGDRTGKVSRSHKWLGAARVPSSRAAPRLPERLGGRAQEPRVETPHGFRPTVCILGNLYHLPVTCVAISGCHADISTPPSCLAPPCFISKQQIRGWCLASRGAQRTGLAFWGTFERLLAGPQMHMEGSCWAHWKNSTVGGKNVPDNKGTF